MTVNGAFSFSHLSCYELLPHPLYFSFYQEVNIDYCCTITLFSVLCKFGWTLSDESQLAPGL